MPPLVAGCGASTGPGQTTDAAPAPKPKNAAEIAKQIVGGRVGMMVWAERIRGHATEVRILALNPLRSALEGTGIELTRDVRAAFVASTGVTTRDVAAAIVEHKLSPAEVQAGLDTLVARSNPPGMWIDGSSVPTARVTVKGQTRTVSIVEPSFIVVLPESLASQASRFIGTGGFPDPDGPEAVIVTALDPSRSLAGAQAPPLPSTISQAVARINLAPDGGVDIATTGDSTDPVQAGTDAKYLTDMIDRATSLNLGIVKVRLFSPVVFRAEGTQVKSNLHLTEAEIDRLLTIADTLMPR